MTHCSVCKKILLVSGGNEVCANQGCKEYGKPVKS